jgi:predicted CopG family antitoxin
MSELKTKQNEASVNDFINSIAEEQKRKDLDAIKDLMEKATKAKTNNVGTCHYWFWGQITSL